MSSPLKNLKILKKKLKLDEERSSIRGEDDRGRKRPQDWRELGQVEVANIQGW